mmetsp:Transcript_9099/g.24539  ORF Transcript_9099/g.24539 Transcript_9099/m.24539 type:complete len:210 (-) Transcript_9099:100-729(-)
MGRYAESNTSALFCLDDRDRPPAGTMLLPPLNLRSSLSTSSTKDLRTLVLREAPPLGAFFRVFVPAAPLDFFAWQTSRARPRPPLPLGIIIFHRDDDATDTPDVGDLRPFMLPAVKPGVCLLLLLLLLGWKLQDGGLQGSRGAPVHSRARTRQDDREGRRAELSPDRWVLSLGGCGTVLTSIRTEISGRNICRSEGSGSPIYPGALSFC